VNTFPGHHETRRTGSVRRNYHKLRLKSLNRRQYLRLHALYVAIIAQGDALLKASSEVDIWRQTALKIAETGLFFSVWIARQDEHQGYVTLAEARADKELPDGSEARSPELMNLVATAWESHEVKASRFPLEDVSVSPPGTSLASALAVPVFRNDRVEALLTLTSLDPTAFDAEIVELCTHLARFLEHVLRHWDDMVTENKLASVQRVLLEHTISGITMAQNRQLIYCNEQFAKMLGYDSTSELIGRHAGILYGNASDYAAVEALYSDLREKGSIVATDVHLQRKDGQDMICDVAAGQTWVEGVETTIWTIHDVTRRKRLEQQLYQNLSFAQTLFERNATGIFTSDANRTIAFVNSRFCEMLGYSRYELVGQSTSVLHVNLQSFEEFGVHFREVLHSDEPKSYDFPLRQKDGTVIWVELLGSRMIDLDGQESTLWSVIDITERLELEERTKYQAFHDALTGLPNRRALELRLGEAINRAQRDDGVFAVGMIDLDDFKPINDTYGHIGGDRVLQELSWRMQARLRATDFLARFGGDEFVVILEDLDEPTAVKQLSIILARLHESVETPFDLGDGNAVEVSMTLGAALYPFAGEDVESLLHQSDAALSEGKKRKLKRLQWWSLGTMTTHESDTHVVHAPYSKDAVELLTKASGFLESITDEFVAEFYDEMSNWEQMEAILKHLDKPAFAALKDKQANHLRMLVNPMTTQQQIVERAQQVGKAHVLTGLSSALLLESSFLYRKILTEQLNFSPIPARRRYQMILTVEFRLQDDIVSELRAYEAVQDEYFQSISRPIPDMGSHWTAVFQEEVAVLGTLPGVVQATLLRCDPQRHTFWIENSFSNDARVSEATLRQSRQIRGRAYLADGFGLTRAACRDKEILSCPSYRLNPAMRAWSSLMELGVNSELTIPFLDRSGECIGSVTLHGAYMNQFESIWMRRFARDLRQRWSVIWQHCQLV